MTDRQRERGLIDLTWIEKIEGVGVLFLESKVNKSCLNDDDDVHK